jgi:hypothetical protein
MNEADKLDFVAAILATSIPQSAASSQRTAAFRVITFRRIKQMLIESGLEPLGTIHEEDEFQRLISSLAGVEEVPIPAGETIGMASEEPRKPD